MNIDQSVALRIASQFVRLPKEKRQIILNRMGETGQSFRLLPIVKARDNFERIPLSYAQQRLLFLWKLDPDNTFYNVSEAVRLTGCLNESTLRETFDRLVQRHESLRTRFVDEDGNYFQVIDDNQSASFNLVDMTVEYQNESEKWIKDAITQETNQPFDLVKGPLLRIKLFRLADIEHVLTVCMHHIISDGWSSQLLIEEFAILYNSLISGIDPVLPELPIQYADYAIWQRSWLEAGEGEKQLAYWRGQLGDDPSLLTLPFDFERPENASFRGATITVNIQQGLATQLKGFSRENGYTLFMIMTVALAVALSRYSGQSDIRIGTPNAGRNRNELEHLVGFFINTQVLRVQVDETQTFYALLDQVKTCVLEAQSHQELPFEQLVDALVPERNLSYNPLFQVKINQNVTGNTVGSRSALKIAQLRGEAFPLSELNTRFDLAFDFTDMESSISAVLTYATDLFGSVTIENIALSLQNILSALVDCPYKRVAEYPESSGKHDFDKGMVRWEGTDFVTLWRQGLRQGNGRLALCFGEQTLDYNELEQCSNRFSRYLLAQGIAPGSVVALCLERSIEWVISLLAVLKAGCAYLPLDSAQPEDRLRYFLEDSGAVYLIHHKDDVKAQGLDVCPALAFDARAWGKTSGIKSDTSSPSLLPIIPEQPAYIIYTSGSTGQPKGVIVSHQALASYVQAVLERLQLSPQASLAMISTTAADLGHTMLFGALASGSLLHLLPHDYAFDPDQFADYMATHQVDVLKIVPSHLQGLLQAARPQDVLPREALILGGESCSVGLVEKIQQLAPHCRIINHYGPTETTVGVCTHELNRQAGYHFRRVPIGVPLLNSQVWIYDDYLNPVASSAVGEIYLGGRCLAHGYNGKPTLTAERFIPNPANGYGGRLYRTGDYGRLVEGQFEFRGRSDDQVKIRGYRVEPGEISRLLQTYDGIRDAVVRAMPVDGDESHLQLVAYCVVDDKKLSVDEILRHLRASLPEHMVPSVIIPLQSMPLTVNGKLDKRALPLPSPLNAVTDYVSPVDEIETRLADIWAKVLKLDRVGTTDNFFELGGDSILSLQIIARARKQSIKISPKQLFDKPTVAQLAKVVEVITDVLAPNVVEEVSGAYELTPIQHKFFSEDIPQRHHWNQAILLTPSQELQARLLQSSLEQLVVHHDALRLSFSERGGIWQAAFLDPASIAKDFLWQVTLVDVTELGAICEKAQQSLDLRHGPLLRAVLVNFIEGGQRLLLVIHHLVVDGVSWRVLLEDLQTVYNQYLNNRLVDLPPKTSSVQAWSKRLQQYAHSETLQHELVYWQTELAGVKTDLPCDNLIGEMQVKHAQSVSSRLDEVWTERLIKVAPSAYRTQVNDLLLTALARVIADWAQQQSILIQLEGHGREDLFDDIDLSRSVGWFTTMFPVRLTPSQSLDRSIKTIKEQLRAIPHKGIGFGVLKYLSDTSIQQKINELPEPRIIFNYLGQFDSSFDQSHASLFKPAVESTGAGRNLEGPLGDWLSINGHIYNGELTLHWSFSGEMYQVGTIQMLAERYVEELQLLIEYCCQRENKAVTPSDFALVHLKQEQLDLLPIPAGEIEDIYPLSPMQQGMLFHTLSEPESGVYLNQMRVSIEGLDVERFRHAWQATLEHHAILRAGFIWEGVEQPIQIIRRGITLPCRVHNWQPQIEAGYSSVMSEALDQLAKERLRIGFEFSVAPLLCLDIVQEAANRHHLIYTNHHILMDGWSGSLLFGEVLQRYQGQIPTVAPGSYRDYLAWLQERDSQAAEHFWREQLAELEEPTLLASSIRHPLGETDTGSDKLWGDYSIELTIESTRCLKEFAKQQQVTVNTVMQAAWLLLLQRYTGQRSVVFGTTVSGRSPEIPGIEQQLGLFINTLPVVCRIDPTEIVDEWLRRIQAKNVALREYEYTPLYEIQHWGGQRGHALFDSIIVYENYPIADSLQECAPLGLLFSDIYTYERNNYGLTLTVGLSDQLTLLCHYNCQQFSGEVVEQLSRQLMGLLHTFSQYPKRAVGSLSLLNEEETCRLLYEWNSTQVDYSADACVHSLFETQAEKTPEATALIFPGIGGKEQQLTYAELNTRSNQLAYTLRMMGVGPDVLVGIAIERSIEMVIGLLGILKAGGAYVPLDPDYPTDRLGYMMEDSGIRLLLTQTKLQKTLPVPADVRALCLDQAESWQQNDASNLPLIVNSQNLAYLIYTSGSTGRPKGVSVSHGGVVNLLCSMVKQPGIESNDWVLGLTSLSFDIAALELYLPLIRGAGIVVLGGDTTKDPQAIIDIAKCIGVKFIQATPSMWKMLVETGERDLFGRCRLLVGGEALPEALAQALLTKTDVLWNVYGPTETTIWSASYCLDQIHRRPYIGRPLDNTTIYILSKEFNMQPVGVVGELYIGGDGVSRGYHGCPGLTAERFVPNPYAEKGSGRLYRTGDLARYQSDGNIEYVGRIDHQVKVRGFRIELGEIESQLQSQEGVKDAVVLARDITGDGNQKLVAYVVPVDGALVAGETDVDRQSAFRAAIKSRLQQVLPDYMVPHQYVLLNVIPLTPNGKLDRKILPAVDGSAFAREYEAPSSRVEKQLAAIWQSVLSVKRIGLNDNFFEMGGNSLSALKIVSCARNSQLFVPELMLQDLMRWPTINLLCNESKRSLLDDILVPLNKILESTPPLFCIHSGWGTSLGYLSLARELDGVRTVYCISCRALIDPSLRHETLEQMAEDYAKVIQHKQADSAYYLLGWSLGGALAVMVAAILGKAGKYIQFLGLVDTHIPSLGTMTSALADWRQQYPLFLKSIAAKPLLESAVPGDIVDPLVSESSLVQWTRTMLERGNLCLAVGYENTSAAEIVRLFVANQANRIANANSKQPLPKVAAQAVYCWWSDRDDKEVMIETLSTQIQCILHNNATNANHDNIIKHKRVLKEVKRILSYKS